jgi:hypothetical protein
MNRLTTLTNTLGSTTLSSYVYGYDSDGHKTSAVETLTGVGTTTYAYAYNALGELTHESASGAGENYAYWYGYDGAGNQVYQSTVNPASTSFMGEGVGTTIRLYDADNRMTESFNDAVMDLPGGM